MIQELKAEGLYAVKGINPEGDKIMRFSSSAGSAEALAPGSSALRKAPLLSAMTKVSCATVMRMSSA